MSRIFRTLKFAGYVGLCVVSLSCSSDRTTSREDRPPFYSRTNLAEYYGRCPKCNHWVTGHWGIWDGVDANGKPFGGSEYFGKCGHCGADVVADDSRHFETDSRIVVWSLRQ